MENERIFDVPLEHFENCTAVRAQAKGKIVRLVYKLSCTQYCSEYLNGKKRKVKCQYGIEEIYTSEPYYKVKQVRGYESFSDSDWLSDREFKQIMADESLFDSRCIDY